ncbi:NADPH-dependent F420 reductase [Actinomadura fibrosa]|uniref:NADPH-dependent F420 reductase n=1 Tax=Actinomadura fibrosa TaxID=111802 RepID=A0ABW2XSB6_9ACTN
MKIGIIGAGMIGGTLAARLADLGHDIVIANSRGPETLAGLVAELGGAVRAGTVAEAAEAGEVVILAIPYGRYRELPAASFAGRIVVDTNNYVPARDGHIAELDSGATTSSEAVAAHLPGASVVKAFNTIYFVRLRDEGHPGLPAAERLAIPVAADDPRAKAVVLDLIDALGFAPVDAGPLSEGRRQEYGKPVFNNPVGPDEAVRLLARG